MSSTRTAPGPVAASLNLPGILLGVGLGGFADGIMLHQILQWHHMLSSEGDYPATTVAGLETNTLWDGFFHLGTWIATVVGLSILWRRTAPPAPPHPRRLQRHLLGLILAGWGTFNLVEGTVDHHILGIHHVKAGEAQAGLDLAFLAVGALLLIGGLALARAGERASGSA